MMSSIIHAQTHTHTRLWSVWLHFFSIVFVSGLNTVHMNQLLHVNTAWWDDNIRFLIRCKPGEIHCELLAVTVLGSAATRERATVAVSMRKKKGLIWFWLFCNYRVRDISSTFQLLLLSFLTPDERSRDVEILSWKSSVTSLHHVHRLCFTTADYLYLKWLFSSPHTHTHTPTAAERSCCHVCHFAPCLRPHTGFFFFSVALVALPLFQQTRQSRLRSRSIRDSFWGSASLLVSFLGEWEKKEKKTKKEKPLRK